MPRIAQEPDHRHRLLRPPRGVVTLLPRHPNTEIFPPPHCSSPRPVQAIVTAQTSSAEGASDVRFGSRSGNAQNVQMISVPPSLSGHDGARLPGPFSADFVAEIGDHNSEAADRD